MALVPFIQDRGFGIVAHPGRTHFMNSLSWRRRSRISPCRDILAAASLQHFSRLMTDLSVHRKFVLIPGGGYMRNWNAPLVDNMLVHFHLVLVVRQALSGAPQAHLPWSQLLHGFLELNAKTWWIASPQRCQLKAAQKSRPCAAATEVVTTEIL